MILLDTCALLWLAMDQSKLSAAAVAMIQRNAGSLHVSSLSAFEIGQKTASGKLELHLPPAVWFPKACELHGIRELPVASTVATTAASLPPIHKDPFDRIITATALCLGMTALTPDENIHRYPGIRCVW